MTIPRKKILEAIAIFCIFVVGLSMILFVGVPNANKQWYVENQRKQPEHRDKEYSELPDSIRNECDTYRTSIEVTHGLLLAPFALMFLFSLGKILFTDSKDTDIMLVGFGGSIITGLLWLASVLSMGEGACYNEIWHNMCYGIVIIFSFALFFIFFVLKNENTQT